MVTAKKTATKREPQTDTYLPYPNSTAAVVYGRHHGDGEDYSLDKTLKWLIEDLQSHISGMIRCEKWMDGAGLAVLENEIAYVGISEHFGRVAVWVCPKDASDSSAHEWAKGLFSILETCVTGLLGGAFTRSEMIKSSPMPKYKRDPNRCAGKKITVAELIEALKYHDGTKEVRIALGPDDPKQCSIGGIAMPFTHLMWGQPNPKPMERTIVLAAGDAVGRLPDSASAQFGWATRSSSLKDIQGEGN